MITSKLFPKCNRISALKAYRSYCATPDVGLKSSYDAVIVGAVFESRHVVGGAAVTEEIVPGFKFSRASYLLSLLRPTIWNDLNLDDYGIKFYFRDPYSYTPLLRKQNGHSSLTLGKSDSSNVREIAKFSTADADNFLKYETFLNNMVSFLEPVFFDMEPLDLDVLLRGRLRNQWKEVKKVMKMYEFFVRNASKDTSVVDVYEILTAPVSKVLGHWFESEVLKATLAVDGMIGAVLGVDSPGSGYVLLHHAMGGVGGQKGAWAYVEGGMGGFTSKLRKVAEDRGVHIFTSQPVKSIEVTDGRAIGVLTADGKFVRANAVLSNATPKVTYLDLVDEKELPEKFLKRVKSVSYKSGVGKINIAAKALPNFTADPNRKPSSPMPHHSTTIHLNTESLSQLQTAYNDTLLGKASERPMIEMTVPSALDPTLAPKGCHVIQLFTQFAPYKMPPGFTSQMYAQRCFDQIEEYAPGFKSSIIDYEVLCPAELEKEFGLTGGNIFHGEMSLDQLYLSRIPVRAPATGLYLCGSGAHPGGGILGTPGMLGANAVIEDRKKKLL